MFLSRLFVLKEILYNLNNLWKGPELDPNKDFSTNQELNYRQQILLVWNKWQEYKKGNQEFGYFKPSDINISVDKVLELT